MEKFIVISGFGKLERVANRIYDDCGDKTSWPHKIGGELTHPKFLAEQAKKIFLDRDKTKTEIVITNSEAAIYAIGLQTYIEETDDVLFLYIDEEGKEHEIRIDLETGFFRPYPKGFCDVVHDIGIEKMRLHVSRLKKKNDN